MEKDHYIGVDISKRTIDVAIYVKNQVKKGTFLTKPSRILKTDSRI